MSKPYQQLFVGLALLPVLFVLSCAHTSHYAEPALPASETAVLQVNLPVWIISIDGLAVPYDLSGDSKITKVTVGPHTVQLSYKGMDTQVKTGPGEILPRMKSRRITSTAYVRLDFVAKPGHVYFVTARHDDKKWYPSIRDFSPANPAASGKE